VVACTRVDARTGLPYFEPSPGKGGLVVKTDQHDEIFVDGWRVGSGSACVEVPPGEHHVRHGSAYDPGRPSFVSVGPGKLVAVLLVRDLSGVPPSVVEDLRRDACGQPEPAATFSPPPEPRCTDPTGTDSDRK
jgi:hypothetical protein